jgi:hypothetical protein
MPTQILVTGTIFDVLQKTTHIPKGSLATRTFVIVLWIITAIVRVLVTVGCEVIDDLAVDFRWARSSFEVQHHGRVGCKLAIASHALDVLGRVDDLVLLSM